jgi:hypothetical protein
LTFASEGLLSAGIGGSPSGANGGTLDPAYTTPMVVAVMSAPVRRPDIFFKNFIDLSPLI